MLQNSLTTTMEDVEKAEVEDEVPDEAWDTEVLCAHGG